MDLIAKIKKTIKERLKASLNIPPSHIETIARYVFSEAIEGNYLEFGVFRGESFISAYHSMESARKDWASKERNRLAFSDSRNVSEVTIKDEMRYFAFDSFVGLPEPKGIDKENARFREGRYDCPVWEFMSILESNCVDTSKVTIIPGWYKDTLSLITKENTGLKSAAVVMVDCDLYESAKLVLEFITDLVRDGTILIFDDWFNFKGRPDRGEQKAVNEWLEKNKSIRLSDYHVSGPVQKSFIVTVD